MTEVWKWWYRGNNVWPLVHCLVRDYNWEVLKHSQFGIFAMWLTRAWDMTLVILSSHVIVLNQEIACPLQIYVIHWNPPLDSCYYSVFTWTEVQSFHRLHSDSIFCTFPTILFFLAPRVLCLLLHICVSLISWNKLQIMQTRSVFYLKNIV